MALIAATADEFDAFLTTFKYDLIDDREKLLALSFAFIGSLPFCDGVVQTPQITQAQLFIAYAMSEEGGSFNPAVMADNRTLIKENLGRSAIVEEFKVNDELMGTDPFTLLKRIPMAYGLLAPFLCPGCADVSGEDARRMTGIAVV